jgi:hypothetical protein
MGEESEHNELARRAVARAVTGNIDGPLEGCKLSVWQLDDTVLVDTVDGKRFYFDKVKGCLEGVTWWGEEIEI